MINRFLPVWLSASIMIMFCCSCRMYAKDDQEKYMNLSIGSLKDSLERIAAKYPGEIGIALLTGEGDTIVVNNEVKYPLMSVFKLHQAIALCGLFENRSVSLDSVVEIDSGMLNHETWSPMLKEHTGKRIILSVRDLLRYTLCQSDNNASNYMFETFCSIGETDSYVATLIPRDGFEIVVTEAEMWSDHARCYENRSSPLSAAMLINRLFTDSILLKENGEFVRTCLKECKTGTDRIIAPLADKEGVTVAHKTGSGFRDENGILAAHNDVAFVSLPDGRHYALAVLVKDFRGSESQAARSIAEISAAVYSACAN